MRRELLRRLEKLEARRPPLVVEGLFWKDYIDRERRKALAPNERIVEDWYLTSYDKIRCIRERITTDPGDPGWNYKETAEGAVIVPDLQREITVVEDSCFCALFNTFQGEIDGASEDETESV